MACGFIDMALSLDGNSKQKPWGGGGGGLGFRVYP